MKFVVVTRFETIIVDADDIYDAINKCDDAHYGTDHIISVTRLPSD